MLLYGYKVKHQVKQHCIYCVQVLGLITFFNPLFAKVKTLSEEATNRKALIESLKRRLNVATTDKSQYETSCAKLKEDLEKKVRSNHTTGSDKKCIFCNVSSVLAVNKLAFLLTNCLCPKINRSLQG